MTECLRFSALTSRLSDLLRDRPDIDLLPLPEGQLLIRKAMVRNPSTYAGLKASAYMPSAEGFEIYVSCQGAGEEDQSPTARVEPPAVEALPGTRLALEKGRQKGYWRFFNTYGERVSVRVQVGARASRSDVNRLLSAIGSELLG